MIKPKRVTFTGIDERTHPDLVREINHGYSVEWGILFGGRLGKNRYPSEQVVKDFFKYIGTRAERADNDSFDDSYAAHLCGAVIAQQIKDRVIPPGIPFEMFNRIQWNALKYSYQDVEWLHWATGLPVIIQHRIGAFPTNAPKGVFFLHDQSGGKGVVPTSRPTQGDLEYVGYAGGIGPDNVTDVLEQIEATNFWIDLETKVRTVDDWLDLRECERLLVRV